MPGLWFYQDPVDRLHQCALQKERRARFARAKSDYRHIEQASLGSLMAELDNMGLRAARTVKNAGYDLWVEGVKVELKAARWHDSPRGGRYQANIRNYEADILIFDCINGTHHRHFIPMSEIKPRKALAVWSYDPAQSTGQWLPFLERWDILLQTIRVANHTWQLPLF